MSSKVDLVNINQEKERELKPKLRFPEFRNAGEWEEKKLGDVAVFFKGKGLPKSAITPNAKNPCIHYGELFTEYPEVIDTIKSRTNLEGDYFLSTANDVLMPTSDVTPNGLAKSCCIKLSEVILGGDILVIQTNKLAISGEFLARYIRYLEKKVLQLVSGSTVFHLYASSINKLALSFPSRPEQQEIADCLSSLDDRITAETQKLDTLKAHKKGLMQQLFPTEGETLPKLRFLEFRDAGEWEELRLSKLTTKISDGIHATPIYDENGEYAFINGNNLKNGKIIIDDKTKRINSSEFNKYKKPLDYNSILMSINGTIGSLAFFMNEQIILGKSVCFINIDSKFANNFFIYNLLQTEKVKHIFISELTGSTIKNLSLVAIKNLELRIPDLLEQQKIADCLSSLDELIAAQTQKIDTLKVHKKGLMQQLFPALDEVIG